MRLPTVPKLDPAHQDARGAIQKLADEVGFGHIGSVVVITSKADTQRANHRHKEDCHLVYLVYGAMEYFERGEDGVIRRYKIEAGTDHAAVFTPPLVDHCMRFLEDTCFVTIGDRHRTQDDYEEDLIRVPSLAEEYDRGSAEE